MELPLLGQRNKRNDTHWGQWLHYPWHDQGHVGAQPGNNQTDQSRHGATADNLSVSKDKDLQQKEKVRAYCMTFARHKKASHISKVAIGGLSGRLELRGV